MGRLDLDFASQMRFGDGAALKEFALAHRLAHAQLASSISASLSIAVSSFDVSDDRARAAWELLMLAPDDAPAQARAALGAWLLLHAQLHQSEYDALGLGVAYDFAAADFAKADQFNTWMFEHQQAHALEADALGIAS